MSLYDIPLTTLSGAATSLGEYKGKAVLIVNVASKCGLTPQYEGLEKLQKTYACRGFTVLGSPCNQFGGQEPGTAEEIETFCSTTYGVTFPMLDKLEVNGDERHPLYAELTQPRTPRARPATSSGTSRSSSLSPEGTVAAHASAPPSASRVARGRRGDRAPSCPLGLSSGFRPGLQRPRWRR